jgi:hypothetical protein
VQGCTAIFCKPLFCKIMRGLLASRLPGIVRMTILGQELADVVAAGNVR